MPDFHPDELARQLADRLASRVELKSSLDVVAGERLDWLREDAAPEASSERSYRDALSQGIVRGRGANLNPGNRFEPVRLHVLGEHLDERVGEKPGGTQVQTRVLEDTSHSILNHVDSPDLGFHWTLNPYRGCEHGCVYCYARPGHEYLGLSSGLDFETQIFAKPRAPELLRKELRRKAWQGEPIVFAGVTDVYQPLEADLRITRRCLEVCLEFRQSISIVTKSKLVLRDLDVLREFAALGLAHVAISLTTLDPTLAASMEPRASSPRARLDTIRALSNAGIPVQVMTAPIIPGLTDDEIPALLRASSNAGARAAGYVLLRLPHQNRELFLHWLRKEHPLKAAKVESLIRQTRGGELYDSNWKSRMIGEGVLSQHIHKTHEIFRRRYRLADRLPPHDRSKFRVPAMADLGSVVHEGEEHASRVEVRGQLGLF